MIIIKKKFIEKDDKKYVLNSDALKKKVAPLLEEKSLNTILKDMIEAEEMSVSLETVKAWYYGTNGTDDLESVKKMAHYLGVEIEQLLIRTDEILSIFSDANEISKRKTIKASIYNASLWIRDSWIKKIALLIIYILLFLFISQTKDPMYQITALLILLLSIRFLDYQYFEREKSWWDKIGLVIQYVFEGFMVLIIIVNIINSCFAV